MSRAAISPRILGRRGQDPATDPWSRARELSSDAVKKAVEARLQAEGIPLVGEIPSDRPPPFLVNCAFWVAQTDLSGSPLRSGALCGVTGDISIGEILALDERAEHVVTSIGVLRSATHQRLGRFPGVPTRRDLEGMLEPCVAACTAEVIATVLGRDPGSTRAPERGAEAGRGTSERGRRRR